MGRKAAQQAEAKHGECRKCRGFCDRMVEPRGCLELRCPNLYSYVDEFSGRRFMGCVQKVFKGEIDVELFEQAELSGEGYGGIKMTGKPLPQCRFTVERAYEGAGADFTCVNPRFYDYPDEIRVSDLRELAGP